MTHAGLFKKAEPTALKKFPAEARVIWIPGTIATGAIAGLPSHSDG